MANVQTGRKVQNASRPQLAHKREYRYFLLQPSLPPREVMVVRDAFGVQAPARPARLLFSFLAFFSTAALPINLLLYDPQVPDILGRPETIADRSN